MSTLQRFTPLGSTARMEPHELGSWVWAKDVERLEADLKLITEAAAKTPCLGPEDPANVAAWILGAARRMVELQASVDHLTECYTSAEREIANFDGVIKDVVMDKPPAIRADLEAWMKARLKQ